LTDDNPRKHVLACKNTGGRERGNNLFQRVLHDWGRGQKRRKRQGRENREGETGFNETGRARGDRQGPYVYASFGQCLKKKKSERSNAKLTEKVTGRGGVKKKPKVICKKLPGNKGSEKSHFKTPKTSGGQRAKELGKNVARINKKHRGVCKGRRSGLVTGGTKGHSLRKVKFKGERRTPNNG